MTEGGAGYSATTVDHFRQPRNVGRLDHPDAYGEVDDRATENFISFYLQIEASRVTATRFRTFGCSACIAASSIATVLAEGRSVRELRAIDTAALLLALDGLPPAKRHCAALAAQALAAAVDDYERRQAAPA